MIDRNYFLKNGRAGDLWILARYLYRIGEEPILSDREYDKLTRLFEEKYREPFKEYLDRTYDDDPIPYALLQEVGLRPYIPVRKDGREELYDVLNEEKSLSINSVTNYRDTYNFVMDKVQQKQDLVASLKMDGVNTKSLYVDGNFSLSLSRGRSSNSFDFTDQVAYVFPSDLKNVPHVMNSQLARFVERYPASSTKFVYDKTPIEKLKQFDKPPLLSMGWLIICEIKQMARLKLVCNSYSNNVIILRVFSRNTLQELTESLKALGFTYDVIDNLVVSEKKKMQYVMEHLEVDEKDARYLVRRHHGYMFDIVSSVRILEPYRPVTRDLIRRLTCETGKYKIYDVLNFLLGSEDVTYKKAVGCVYQYRYAFDHLSNYLKNSVEMYEKVFNFVIDGELSLQNYKIFLHECNDSTISAMSEYQLRHVLESFDTISLDWLYLLEQLLNQLGKNDISGLLNILALRKG